MNASSIEKSINICLDVLMSKLMDISHSTLLQMEHFSMVTIMKNGRKWKPPTVKNRIKVEGFYDIYFLLCIVGLFWINKVMVEVLLTIYFETNPELSYFKIICNIWLSNNNLWITNIWTTFIPHLWHTGTFSHSMRAHEYYHMASIDQSHWSYIVEGYSWKFFVIKKDKHNFFSNYSSNNGNDRM